MADTGRIPERIRRALFGYLKASYQASRSRPARQKIVFIVGCQRSGTTMLSRVFERDLNAKVYSERSAVTTQDQSQRIRLNDLESVRKLTSSVNAPLVVLKPLVESQRTPELLDCFDDSQAIWIYRDFKDVAFSNRNRFGASTGIDDIRPIVAADTSNWRSERASPEVRTTIGRFFSEEMDPYDAAVLFWFARNSLFFELGLDRRSDVILCKYEDLVTRPQTVCAGIYAALERPFSRRFVANVHAKSVNRGTGVQASVEVNALAEALMQRLDQAYAEAEHVHRPAS